MLDNGIDLNIYKTMYLSNKTYQLTDRPKNNLRVICNFYRNQIAEHSTEMVGVAEWLGHRSCNLVILGFKPFILLHTRFAFSFLVVPLLHFV